MRALISLLTIGTMLGCGRPDEPVEPATASHSSAMVLAGPHRLRVSSTCWTTRQTGIAQLELSSTDDACVDVASGVFNPLGRELHGVILFESAPEPGHEAPCEFFLREGLDDRGSHPATCALSSSDGALQLTLSASSARVEGRLTAPQRIDVGAYDRALAAAAEAEGL